MNELITGGEKRGSFSEFLLLLIFLIFLIAFFVDLWGTAMETKLTFYVMSPLAGGLVVYRLAKLVKRGEFKIFDKSEIKAESLGIGWVIAVFILIYLLGYYIGSFLFLLIFFRMNNHLNRKTLTVTVILPLVLYFTFEKILNMSLYYGVLLKQVFL